MSELKITFPNVFSFFQENSIISIKSVRILNAGLKTSDEGLIFDWSTFNLNSNWFR